MESHEFEEEPDEPLNEEAIPEAAFSSPTVPPAAANDAPHYWHAAISKLPPERQQAAWRFYNEHQLDVAGKATDVLTGLVLLMEGNGLFMNECARSVSQSFDRLAALNPPPPPTPLQSMLAIERIDSALKQTATRADIDRIEAMLRLSSPASLSAGSPPTWTPAGAATAPVGSEVPGKLPPHLPKSDPRPWIISAGVSLLAFGAAFWVLHQQDQQLFRNRLVRDVAIIRKEAEEQTKADELAFMNSVRDEQTVKGLLTSQQAIFKIEHSVQPPKYSIVVKGTKILKADIEPDGSAIIEFPDKEIEKANKLVETVEQHIVDSLTGRDKAKDKGQDKKPR